jgi:membrane-associated protease RseP (regulator of RpoE activity)
MNAQEAILKIKALFEDNAAPVEEVQAEETKVDETKVEMAEYSLMDGTKVEISALEIGGSVTIEGQPAPAGDHELMDGTEITLDENGIIVEIESKEVVATPEVDTEVEAKKEEDKKMAEMAEQFEAKIAELVEAKNVSDVKVLELENKIKQGFAQVAELIEALSNTPSEDPIQKPNSFNSFVNTSDIKGQRLEKYRQAILNTKN